MIVDPAKYLCGNSMYNKYFTIVPGVQEVIIHVILFVGALMASFRNSTGVPIPRGVAKVLTNFSFCFSCFCCCVCCSQKCRIRALRSLVMFSFMMFIYRSIMDVISFAFLMFVEQSRVLVVTIALLYASTLVFFVLCVSFSLFMLLHGRNAGMSFAWQLITFVGGLCMLISVFGAVGMIVVLYLILILSLRLEGFSGVLTGLIPTIALSAASWYIKKRLLKRAFNPPTQDQQPKCAATKNSGHDEKVEVEQRRLLHI